MRSKRLHKTRAAAAAPRSAAAGGRLHKKTAAPPAAPLPVEKRIPTNATFRLQYVKCGKHRCAAWHGPYWYAFVKVGGKTKSFYIGKDQRMAKVLEARAGAAHARELLDLGDDGDGDVELFPLTPEGRRFARDVRRKR
jgi:hypothetical protein